MPSTEPTRELSSELGDLPTSELLTHGQTALEWIARYLDHPERVSVLSRAVPGETREMLPPSPPEHAEPLGKILQDFESQIVPGITHWNHPGFFGYFATSSSVPGIIGEMLVAALDVKAMLWRTSPAATELEQVTSDWLRQMLGLPGGWFGFLNDTASISSMLEMPTTPPPQPPRMRLAWDSATGKVSPSMKSTPSSFIASRAIS